jgi:hypothetical protein
MLISTGVCIVLLLLIKQERLDLAWSWLVVIGTGITFALGCLLGTVVTKSQNAG